jgi:hypothetical protein
VSSIYIETSIVGYLASRSTKDVIFCARQELTRIWWDSRRERYEAVISQLVLDEAAAGDGEAAAERLELLDGIGLLDISDPRIAPIADVLVEEHLLPEKARSDAVHVATATVHATDYLLTWNCKHIANAQTLPGVYRLLTEMGYSPPLIVTPEEFSENA